MKRHKTAWALGQMGAGYLLLGLTFSAGRVDLLPDWGGYLLLVWAMGPLAVGAPALSELRPAGVLLGVWAGIFWLLQAAGKTGLLALPCLLANVLALYVQFQLLTELGTLLPRLRLPGQGALWRLRTGWTVLAAVGALPVAWEQAGTLLLLLQLAQGLTGLGICGVLLGAVRRLLDGGP